MISDNELRENILNAFIGKNIGVLGTGYVATRLINLLKSEKKINVICLTRLNLLDKINKHTFDYFFNCAGNTGDFRTKIDETLDSNLFLNQFLVKNLVVREAFVYLSSTRVYGFCTDNSISFNEEYQSLESHTNIDFIYNGTKKLTESYLLNIKLPYRVIVCRLSNLFGDYSLADLDDSTYIKVMVKHFLEKKELIINQNINSSKDYIFIEDALNGIIKSAVNAPKTDYFNIASGSSYSLTDWLNYLATPFEATNQQQNAVFSRIDVTKSKKILDFTPKYNLSNLEKIRLFSTT